MPPASAGGKNLSMIRENEKKQTRIGILCAVSSALIWGALPIYWKSIESLNSLSIMFYRVILAFVIVFIVCLIVYGPKKIVEPLKDKKTIAAFFFAGLTISLNWGLYIWAVNSEHIIQTSIGYYINPLFVAAMGVIIFHEKVSKHKIGSLLIAIVGVCIMIVSYGQIPTVALVLAVSFTIYTGIKKKLHAPALLALLYETGLMLPIAIPCTIYMEVTGAGAFVNADPHQLFLLSFAGILTAIPLTLFGFAANRMRVIDLGLIQYLSPTITLLIGIFMFNEPFDLFKFLGFICIWIAIAIFTVGEKSSIKT